MRKYNVKTAISIDGEKDSNDHIRAREATISHARYAETRAASAYWTV